jgi:hypothetical protein
VDVDQTQKEKGGDLNGRRMMKAPKILVAVRITEAYRRRAPRNVSGLGDLYPLQLFQLLARRALDVGVQAVAVRIHSHDRCETIDADVPHGFGNAEFH